MKPWLFSVSVKPVPFLRRWMRLFWTESHIAGDRDTGKRRNDPSVRGRSVDSHPGRSERDRTGSKKHSPMSPMSLFAACKSLNLLNPPIGLFGLCQAAVVISAACHITQTKPLHDASDKASRTQRAMILSPDCVFWQCSMFLSCSGQVVSLRDDESPAEKSGSLEGPSCRDHRLSCVG